LYAVRQALHHYLDERIWRRIQLNGMTKDFSWKGPAMAYSKLYEAARVAQGFAPARKMPEIVAENEGPSRRRTGKSAQAAGQSLPDSEQAAQGPG
jgi:hypothetical protein